MGESGVHKLGEPFDRRDLFWFGPEEVTRANVVVVVYKPTTEKDWAVDGFELAEQYLIDDFYGDCTSLDLSQLISPTIAP